MSRADLTWTTWAEVYIGESPNSVMLIGGPSDGVGWRRYPWRFVPEYIRLNGALYEITCLVPGGPTSYLFKLMSLRHRITCC